MKFQRLIRISRPRFWIYELGPYAIGVVAAASHTANAAWLTVPIAIFFLFFMYPANIYIYGINDIYDYETDKLNPKKVLYESLVLPHERKDLFKHIALVCIPFALYGIYIGSFSVLIALAAFFFFAGFYSAPPIRAKARPFFDSIFSAGHYVATGVFSYVLVARGIAGAISPLGIGVGILAGMCWAIAMHAYSAVPDIAADGEAGLATIATKLGRKNTVMLCAALYILSAAVSFYYLGIIAFILAIIYVFLMALSFNASDEKLFTVYTYFPFVNTIVGAAIFFLLLLK